jgi:probable rRNA maturation factor
MIVNQQNEIRIDLAATRKFVGRLRRCLGLGERDFNVCFVGDEAICALNAAYRGKARPTDVLSFPWAAENGDKRRHSLKVARRSSARAKNIRRETIGLPRAVEGREFSNFLGDVVISVETARQNARAEGHSVAREIRWLILHGALHLLGYDHASDGGVMTELEQKLRAQMDS